MRKRFIYAAVLAATLAAAGCARQHHHIASKHAMADVPDACKNLTPDDTFWWWWYGCSKDSAGGGSGGAG